MQMSFADGSILAEEQVADTIVRARKSWKTVKGKSEPVWPPHLEKALVQALLQYRPNDSRYARALGRFPKRNRYISDFIYEQTGVRRSPKQVGSRLQQLKDVNCGKQLLNQVASWSLGLSSNNAVGYGYTNMRLPSLDGYSSPADSTPSPISSLPRTSPDSLRVQNVEHVPQLHISTGPYTLPQTAPRPRRLSVYVTYDPRALRKKSALSHPLRCFAGCLERPETIFAPEAQTAPIDLTDRQPYVVFSSREPILAVSLTHVCMEQRMYAGEVRSSIATVEQYSQPLVCTQQPTPLSPTGSQGYGSTKAEDAARHSQEYYVYETSLVNESMWNLIQQSGADKYTLVQELVCKVDCSHAQRNETFLTITYHFVSASLSSPISGYSMGMPGNLSPSTSSGSLSPTHGSPSFDQLRFPIAPSNFDGVSQLPLLTSGFSPTGEFGTMNMNVALNHGAAAIDSGATSDETHAYASRTSLPTYSMAYDPGLDAQLNSNFRTISSTGVNDLHLNPLL